MSKSLLPKLYISFMKIGGLTFGGGLSMLPMLKYELVEKREWISEDDLLNCYAIGQCTPGIIAVNTATFVGYKKAGVIGGIVSTLGMITPSLVIITIIAAFLQNFMDNDILQSALMGVRGAVCALMLNTLINMGKKSLVNIATWVICAIAFLLIIFAGLPSIFIVVFGGICGIVMDKVSVDITQDTSHCNDLENSNSVDITRDTSHCNNPENSSSVDITQDINHYSNSKISRLVNITQDNYHLNKLVNNIPRYFNSVNITQTFSSHNNCADNKASSLHNNCADNKVSSLHNNRTDNKVSSLHNSSINKEDKP